MEHKITIEILIKTDFLKQEEPTSKVHALKINPEIVNSLIPQLVKAFQPENLPKKTKSKKVVKK